jgi:ribosomal protein S18 acetylase RimI-like enzyme
MAQSGPATPRLATVRRFEAAGFRAWPAATVHYDGTWVIRLTAGHPAKRLNSVNPLDPGDVGNLAERIGRAARRFEAYGRPLTFRLSPLSGPALSDHLDSHGWSRFSESLVMQARLDSVLGVDGALDQIPLRDVGRFTAAALEIQGLEPRFRAGLSEVIGSIRPQAGLFVLEEAGRPVSTAICVHDGDVAGLFEIATEGSARRHGHGRRIVLSALKWAKLRGAAMAWLQVEADNEPAIALYQSLGFHEVYRYHYRRLAAP